MNWGKSIVLVFVLFAGFIGTMVFWMTRQRVDLVREDYYQNEIAYQRHIERISRTARLKAPVIMTYQAAEERVDLELPELFRKGEVTFYRPSDRLKDGHVSLRAEHRQRVSTARLAKGYWKVQINWSDGRADYFTEKDLFVE